MQLEIGAQGLKIGTQSLLTLLAGGIVFDTPKPALNGPPSPPDSTFQLYVDREAAEEAAERVRVSYRLFFPGRCVALASGPQWSCAGLPSDGSPS